MIALYTAFTIGLVGSLHCIGMCGPIAIALPIGSKSYGNRITGTMLYNLGRILTYGILGALFGTIGKGLEMAGIQKWISILLGIIMIGWVVFPMIFKKGYSNFNFGGNLVHRLVFKLKKLFQIHSFANLFLIGFFNGFLPCGLVYVAVAGALNTHDTLTGILYMMIFGLGTLPLMASVSLVGNVMSSNIKYKLSRVLPVFIVALGIIFILRGLTLGIPYISPKEEALNPTKEVKVDGSCCSPKKH
ncbi:MAG: sulfite exporter TauE/SafE family protein [Bacteroidales bacterium]